MSLIDLAKQFTDAGFAMDVEGNALRFELSGETFEVEPDADWTKTIDSYVKAKQYEFDESRHILKAYKSVEAQLVRLGQSMFSRPEYKYQDVHGGELTIALASREYCLAYTLSKSALRPLDIVRRRIELRTQTMSVRSNGKRRLRRFEDLLVLPYTARYSVSRKVEPSKLLHRAVAAMKSALFKLAYSQGDCFELRESVKPGTPLSSKQEKLDGSIPNVAYNDDLLKYYKVAKSSVFPNQQFLSYYHVLEYFFLRVSDENVHIGIKAIVNSPSFNASYDNVSRLLATLRKHDTSSDETEMLKAVLAKFVDEDDLVAFIQALEAELGERIYSDTKKKVFGQVATISLQKGHALHAAARVTKQIRNALVHSSDKYNREDCFLPLTESEHTVRAYVPLVRFLAERVIYATATGA